MENMILALGWLGVSAPLALGVYWLVEGPILSGRGDLVQAGGAAALMALGFLIALPFTWKDLKLMLSLGGLRKPTWKN